VEVGIGRCGYGKRVEAIHLKFITRSECRGEDLSSSLFVLVPYVLVERRVRVSASIYSADARFVITGSDDGNVRIWKAKASDKLGIITARERAAMEYRESLKERWKVDAEVDRVMRYARFPDNHYTGHSTFLQNTPSAEVCPTSSKVETHDVGGTESEGGKEAETHQGWRKQAKSREEDGGYCGTDLTVEYGFGIPRNTSINCCLRLIALQPFSFYSDLYPIRTVYLKSPSSWCTAAILGDGNRDASG
jgi:hypothetical protein